MTTTVHYHDGAACLLCAGAGDVPASEEPGTVACGACAGTGKAPTTTCPLCHPIPRAGAAEVLADILQNQDPRR